MNLASVTIAFDFLKSSNASKVRKYQFPLEIDRFRENWA
jgi:hypothetical protein